MVPTAENIGSLFPPEMPKDLPETWPCTKQVLPTDPCWREAITDNDLFRNTPTDKPFLSSTTFFGMSRLVADFKTDRTPPARPEDVAEAYVAQLAVYGALLSRVFGGRVCEARLIYTAGPHVHVLAPARLAAARARLSLTSA